LADVSAQLNTSRDHLAEAQKQLEDNGQVMEWLNKELNETKMGKMGLGATGTTRATTANTTANTSMDYSVLRASNDTSVGAAGLSSIYKFRPSMPFTPVLNSVYVSPRDTAASSASSLHTSALGASLASKYNITPTFTPAPSSASTATATPTTATIANPPLFTSGQSASQPSAYFSESSTQG
jgi:hypothetical protein